MWTLVRITWDVTKGGNGRQELIAIINSYRGIGALVLCLHWFRTGYHRHDIVADLCGTLGLGRLTRFITRCFPIFVIDSGGLRISGLLITISSSSKHTDGGWVMDHGWVTEQSRLSPGHSSDSAVFGPEII
jgi:hypothetical protein